MDPLEDQPLPLPNYSQVNAVLEELSAPLSAAECHGVLCGMLCSPHPVSEEEWLLEVLEGTDTENARTARCRLVLQDTRNETIRRLNSNDFEFAPLLPADDETLATRSEALGSWCRGFLAGLGLGGVRDLSLLPSDTQEIIGDLSEMARIDTDPEVNESSETAFAELLEYVRVGVMLVNEELRPSSNTTSTTH